MDLINRVFYRYLAQFVIVFIDDIFIYSQNPVRHIEQLRDILQTLQEDKWFMVFSNFEFWLNQVMFLGHIISSDGLKIEALESWERLKMVSEV